MTCKYHHRGYIVRFFANRNEQLFEPFIISDASSFDWSARSGRGLAPSRLIKFIRRRFYLDEDLSW